MWNIGKTLFYLLFITPKIYISMNMPNTFREKLKEGKPTIGTHYLSSDPDLPEIIGDTGLYDYGEFSAEYTVGGGSSATGKSNILGSSSLGCRF